MPELADFQRLGEIKPAAVTLLTASYGRDSLPLLVRQRPRSCGHFRHRRQLALADGTAQRRYAA